MIRSEMFQLNLKRIVYESVTISTQPTRVPTDREMIDPISTSHPLTCEFDFQVGFKCSCNHGTEANVPTSDGTSGGVKTRPVVAFVVSRCCIGQHSATDGIDWRCFKHTCVKHLLQIAILLSTL